MNNYYSNETAEREDKQKRQSIITFASVHRHAHQHVRIQKQHLAFGFRRLSGDYCVDLRVRIRWEFYRVLRHAMCSPGVRITPPGDVSS